MPEYIDRKLENIFVLKNLIELKRHRLEEENIYKIQNRKIEMLMKRAYEIPLYRKKFEQIGAVPRDFRCREDLTKFPLLEKREIQEWIPKELEKNPEKYKYYHIYTTSGSTGTPLKLCASPRENAYFTANWLRIIMENGVNPFFDTTMALKDPAVVSAGKDSLIQKLGVLRRHKISYLEETEKIVEKMNRIKPDFFYAQRIKLIQMIEYAKKNHLALHHPKVYASIGETLTEPSIRLFQENFGECLFTSYGSMETGACTFTKIGDEKYHIVMNDTHVINIVDKENQQFQKGRMILTNLFLHEFPIINYDIGDGAETVTRNGVEYLKNIQGRLNDWIKLEDGRKYDHNPFYVATEKLEDIISFRIIQNTYHDLDLEFVADPSKSVDKNSIERTVRRELKNFIPGYDMNYHFIWKDKLESDANGKRRFIVNKLEEKRS
ncbi:MAG: hypothetical protein HFI37_02035 [Lachnospiraceae bacterium]|nr:hypothetical protein [Lachnospiraceae bacterium]